MDSDRPCSRCTTRELECEEPERKKRGPKQRKIYFVGEENEEESGIMNSSPINQNIQMNLPEEQSNATVALDPTSNGTDFSVNSHTLPELNEAEAVNLMDNLSYDGFSPFNFLQTFMGDTNRVSDYLSPSTDAHTILSSTSKEDQVIESWAKL